ncbi:MAG: sensor histidine kinase [Acidobacteriaceae bacterium]
MRLKTKLVLAITALVFICVVSISWLFMGQLLQVYLNQSYTSTDSQAHQVLFAVRQALDVGLNRQTFDVNDPAAVHAAVANSLQSSPGLNNLMNSIVDYSQIVQDVSITDEQNHVLAAAPDPTLVGQVLKRRPDYASLRKLSMHQFLNIVFGPPRVYDVSLGLDLSGKPFLRLHLGVRTTFLRNSLRPWLIETLLLAILVLIGSVAISAGVANLALAPIEIISQRLDTLEQTQSEGAEDESSEEKKRKSGDAVEQVSGKIERIGRRMRNVEEVFTALKENLDQVLSNLQDGMILFTSDARAILVSNSVERFLGIRRDDLLGAEVRTIFDRETRLGRLIRDSFDAGMSIVQEEITTETGRRIQISLDFIHDEQPSGANSLGALLTLHDVESIQELETELELSHRMASIGRLTAGVGHEVKNPINAIVVHMELLRNKMQLDAGASHHLEIIESEIRRLDRVVQTLVDFSRPVEMHLRDQDLRQTVKQVMTLASVELEGRGVAVTSRLPESPVMVKIDSDLLKQALLNVVLNGAQAMPEGGRLEVKVATDSRWATISVRDYGTGIPPEVLPRIFDLYFTTKSEGSGIGLAMTYRIVQFQNGRIDVESKTGSGTTFHLRLPLAAPQEIRSREEQDSATGLTEGTSLVKGNRP